MNKEKNGIPSQEECFKLMAAYRMLPNIMAHSAQVMRVAVAIADNLRNGTGIDRRKVMAGALLHDITKTRSIRTKERHDETGGMLLRELGFAEIGAIVEQHVYLRRINIQGPLEEREIVFYADKRVMHDQIVSLDERLRDLVRRYGVTEEISGRIMDNKGLVIEIERKISGFMKVDLQETIENLRPGLLRLLSTA
jgi:uncharacterized protein